VVSVAVVRRDEASQIVTNEVNSKKKKMKNETATNPNAYVEDVMM